MGIPKLFQWLLAGGAFLAIWAAYIVGFFKANVRPEFHEIIIALPIYLLISFACFSLAVVGYRVATFNDCVEASEELKKQIEEAKRDLERKGYKYASDWK